MIVVRRRIVREKVVPGGLVAVVQGIAADGQAVRERIVRALLGSETVREQGLETVREHGLETVRERHWFFHHHLKFLNNLSV